MDGNRRLLAVDLAAAISTPLENLMPIARIAAVNLECANPADLARFWAAMLDGEVAVETPDFCAVKAGTIYLGAVHANDYQPPTWPSSERSQQLHICAGRVTAILMRSMPRFTAGSTLLVPFWIFAAK